MKKLIACFSLALGAVCAVAQTATLRIENDSITVDGIVINKAYINDTSPEKLWQNFTVYSAFASAADLTGLSFVASDPATFLSEVKALGTNPIFAAEGGWATVSLATGPVATLNDWSLTRASLDQASGLHPVLLVSTSPLSSLSTNDFVGLVYSAAKTVPALSVGAITVNFSEGWDTALIGQLGSLALTPIPEPAHYAFLLGALGLGVIWRRRR